MTYNPDLLRTLEDRFGKIFNEFDGVEDLYSFIASIMYDKKYLDCCEWKDEKPNPQGKELRDRVKQFLIPIVEECGGISEGSISDEPIPEAKLPLTEEDG